MTDEPTWPSPSDPTDPPEEGEQAAPAPPAPPASPAPSAPPAPPVAATPPAPPLPPAPPSGSDAATPVPPPPPAGVVPPPPGVEWPAHDEPPAPTGRRRRLLVPLLALGAVAAAATLLAGGTGAEQQFDGRARTADSGALAAAGCAEVDPGSDEDRSHLDPADAPPASELYDVPLPAQGPHFGAWSPVLPGVPAVAVDPRAVLHNLEHGAVAVWVDPDVIGEASLDEVAAWRDQLGAAGFDNADTGAAVFTSRVPDDVPLDAGVALRAWGVAVDCPGWDLAAVDAFVALHYGTRGDAPESGLGPYPVDNGVLLGPPGQDGDGTTTV